ncbi:MAG: alpha/beta fold hydrolase [Polyangiaceae bacterium]|jgi:pimeloyl-ACP methyl ester carboxylesterase|nr:alpha/beta fold hydrolase [Polyangiaceae bacterium]
MGNGHWIGGLALAATLGIACGDDSLTGGAGGAGGSPAGGGGGSQPAGGAPEGGAPEGGGGAGPVEVELNWYACPYEPGQNGQCVKAQIPADWDDPDGPKITSFVKRIPAAVQPARGQLWILQGGPGFSGTTIEFDVARFAEVVDDLDFYVPDHRGTGFSTELECPELEQLALASGVIEIEPVAEAAADCADDLVATHGETLPHFSATQAGRDLGELIERTRSPGQEVYLYGVSYGTRWLHRYLQQFPAQATGLIFDSISAEQNDWMLFDVEINGIAEQFFDLCGQDAYCSSKLGADPWAFMAALMGKLEMDHCPTSLGLTKRDYKAFFAAFVVKGFYDRALLPALAYRVDRCDATDQDVIERLYDLLQPTEEDGEYFSGGLHFHVVNSERVSHPPPSVDELIASAESLFVSSEQMPAYRATYDPWPIYDAGPYLGTFAETSTPILMMQSPLDAQTVIGPTAEFEAAYDGPNQTFVVVERSGHAVLSQAPMADGSICGMVLAAQFLLDPTSALDTSCKDEVLPIDFEQAGFNLGAGTLNVWDNAITLLPSNEPSALDRLRMNKSFEVPR